MDIQTIEHYLNIDSSKYHEPSLEALNYYIKRYMLAVPFENINVQNGMPVSVEINDLYDKLINAASWWILLRNESFLWDLP